MKALFADAGTSSVHARQERVGVTRPQVVMGALETLLDRSLNRSGHLKRFSLSRAQYVVWIDAGSSTKRRQQADQATGNHGFADSGQPLRSRAHHTRATGSSSPIA
jgi:hypothetical protein